MSEKVWEFTFMAVQAGETYEEALSAVLEYLAEQADKSELEPTASRVLGDDEYEVVA
jgi:GTP cyclohydrolase I